MTSSLWRRYWVVFIAMLGLPAFGAPVLATEDLGTVAVLSDIHFDPFAVPELAARLASSGPKQWPEIFASVNRLAVSGRGENTNQVLLASALRALSEQGARADLIVVSGDLLGHNFQERAARALGPSASGDEVIRELASKTAVYVADAIGAAFPGRPVVIALGNNDSACGDYQLEPGGSFLASLRDSIRALAGSDRLDQDFDQTYTAGGYYGIRHPGLAQTMILVISDVLWSANYRNACGVSGDQDGDVMMDWLSQQLEAARAAGRRVWLVHHLPTGIDPYTTFQSRDSTCKAQVSTFLKEPYASRFLGLLRNYATTIQASFSGHTHGDSYRVVANGDIAVGVEKVTPSISPVFGNNPSFHLFNYDRRTGDLMDFSKWYLGNLDQASAGHPSEWRREYVFTEAYGQPTYSAAAILEIAGAMLEGDAGSEAFRLKFRRLHSASDGELRASEFRAYACSIHHLDLSSYAGCYCAE